MPVIYRVGFPCRIQDQHGIEFQSLGIVYRKHHDPVLEPGTLHVLFQGSQTVSQIQVDR